MALLAAAERSCGRTGWLRRWPPGRANRAWPVKFAPFFIPPFRALLMNERSISSPLPESGPRKPAPARCGRLDLNRSAISIAAYGC